MTHIVGTPRLKVLIAERTAIEWKRISNLVESVEKIVVINIAKKGSTLSTALAEATPDVLIIDIDTPERKGINLLKMAHDQHPAMMIVVLSSNSSHIYTRICKAAGATHVVDKSTEFHLIAPLLEKFAEQTRVSQLSKN